MGALSFAKVAKGESLKHNIVCVECVVTGSMLKGILQKQLYNTIANRKT